MKILITLLVLASAAHADVSFALMPGTGERVVKLPALWNAARCGDQAYTYLVQNAEQIEQVTIGFEAIWIKLRGSPEPKKLSRVFGTRGFLDFSEIQTLYVWVDLAKPNAARVVIGMITRKSGSREDRTNACSERWTALATRVKR